MTRRRPVRESVSITTVRGRQLSTDRFSTTATRDASRRRCSDPRRRTGSDSEQIGSDRPRKMASLKSLALALGALALLAMGSLGYSLIPGTGSRQRPRDCLGRARRPLPAPEAVSIARRRTPVTVGRAGRSASAESCRHAPRRVGAVARRRHARPLTWRRSTQSTAPTATPAAWRPSPSPPTAGAR